MKTNKVSAANIFGFDETIRNMIPFHNATLRENWGSKIEEIKFNDKLIHFHFFSNGDEYHVSAKAMNDRGDFKGIISVDDEVVGTCFLHLFESASRYVLWGDWVENDFTWPVLIEVYFES